MKTKNRTTKVIAIAVTALALASASFAQQQQKPPVPGTYYSAKDFEWKPPLPFNPHPGLPAVEFEPGRFLVDDTGLPDTPEQAAARAAHQAAVEHAKALAANPALAEAERAARQAAQEAAWKATFQTEFAPWIVTDERDAPGNVTTAAGLEEARKSALLKLGEQTAKDAQATKDQVAQFARTNTIGLPESWTDAEGRRHIIDRIGPEGTPYIKHAHNLGSAITVGATNLWPGGPLGLGLTGTNVSIGLWDEGHVLTNHQEFTQSGLRVSLMDVAGSVLTNDHATHVAGTLGAWGVVGAAKGFSHRGRILSSRMQTDFETIPPIVATNAVRISNHSYGYNFGWYYFSGAWYWLGQNNWSATEDWQFGYYDSVARTNDMLIYTAQTFLPVFSSGNENWEGPTTQPVWHWAICGGNWQWTNTIRPLDGGVEGYHTANTYAVSKNNLVVGAVDKIPSGYTSPTNVSLAWFSSAGPTDDGRIKPDLVAAGIGLYSTTYTNATSYGTKSGTSMVAPSVAGLVGLLTDLHQRHFGTQQPLLASSLKA
ncbi:MAG: S8 family serine peptidase, partial [Verrucomicrobiota bacterium]|nr:S8 family serine peptidase [Verrucomicrobiota bacterium]